MISFRTGNILAEDVEALVNTVNCVGVMGRGIALQFKNAYPENFHAYAEACKRGEVRPGHMFVYETDALTNPRYIVNFPTKRHWRNNSRMDDIESGLKNLASVIRERDIRSIALPPLGAGLGKLEWSRVRSRVEQALSEFDHLDIVVFEPRDALATESMVRSRTIPKMTEGRAALIGLMDRYLRSLLDPFITLLEVHKLMYLLQTSGEPLQLRYRKAAYGPYAENLRHVLNEIEGHFILGFGDGGEAPEKPLTLLPGAVDKASSFLEGCAETRERLGRVGSLVSGFESAFGLELLSTVHWVIEHDEPTSEADLIRQTYAWNKRKKQFSARQIMLAADVLRENGWNAARFSAAQ